MVLGLGTAGSSARPPGQALGVSVRDSPALDGYKPLIPGVGLQGWLQVPLGNWRNSGNFHPLSFLAVGSDPFGTHPSAGCVAGPGGN